MEITWVVIGVGVALALVAYVKLNFGGMKKEDFLKLYQQEGGEIIDVRTASEYSSGHYKNSKNLDFNSGQFEKSISKLDPSGNFLAAYSLVSSTGYIIGLNISTDASGNTGTSSQNSAVLPRGCTRPEDSLFDQDTS